MMAWQDPFESENRAALCRQQRLLRLAEKNGLEIELYDRDGQVWWLVPPMWLPIVGCMSARVA